MTVVQPAISYRYNRFGLTGAPRAPVSPIRRLEAEVKRDEAQLAAERDRARRERERLERWWRERHPRYEFTPTPSAVVTEDAPASYTTGQALAIAAMEAGLPPEQALGLVDALLADNASAAAIQDALMRALAEFQAAQAAAAAEESTESGDLEGWFEDLSTGGKVALIGGGALALFAIGLGAMYLQARVAKAGGAYPVAILGRSRRRRRR
jgi:hypothetical protein